MNFYIRLPEYWTAKQAEFMHDLVELLHEALWRQYGQVLCEHWSRPDSNRHPFEDDEESTSAR